MQLKKKPQYSNSRGFSFIFLNENSKIHIEIQSYTFIHTKPVFDIDIYGAFKALKLLIVLYSENFYLWAIPFVIRTMHLCMNVII